ncbi:MAG: YjdF family protein [Clostridiales bacterium]|nr:YjdF family protein [Clostridiales bacterium]
MLTSIRLIVFFEDPFWVGVFEKNENNLMSACRIVFGSEPKDYEVYDLVLKKFYDLKFSAATIDEEIKLAKINPKRFQREIKKQVKDVGIGTKAQLAMKSQQEANKVEKKKKSKEEKEREKERKFQLRQEKKKQKHRGH